MQKNLTNLITYLKTNAVFIVVSSVYVVLYLLISFRGNIALNDDWIFVLQIKQLLEGKSALSSLIDPSFIGQGSLGLVWGKIFGASFMSLRNLTLLFSLGFFFILYVFLKELKLKNSVIFVLLSLIVFNPIVFFSTFSFMTEIYFLFFYTIALYFYFLYFEKNIQKYLWYACVASVCATLIRQPGLILFIAVLITLLTLHKKYLREIFIPLIALLISIITIYFWPKYMSDGITITTGGFGAVSSFIHFSRVVERLELLFYSIFYFVFFTLPIHFKYDNTLKRSKKVLLLGFILSLVISHMLYILDIFPIGNVFYVEGLFAKTNFREIFGLFDNVFFKLTLSFLIAYAFVRFLILFDFNKKLNSSALFLVLTFLGSLAVLIFGTDLYDRYLLPSFISLVIFISYQYKDNLEFNSNLQYVILLFFFLFSIFNVSEYLMNTKYRWYQGHYIQSSTSFYNSIYVDDTFTKYYTARKTQNYTKDVSSDLPRTYSCFVQKYTVDNGRYAEVVSRLNDRLKNYFENPEIYNSKRNSDMPNIKKHLDALINNKEYFSPIYNLVGKKAYVGSWCSN